MTKITHDDFSEQNEVASNWVSWGVPLTDKVFGTLIAKRQMKSTLPGKEGELVWVYELKGEYGQYHQLDEKKNPIEPVVQVEKGAFYNIGGKPMIDRQMQNIKIGQKVGLKYIEEVPSKTKGFAPSKIVKVYAPKNDDGSPKMDEEHDALAGEFSS